MKIFVFATFALVSTCALVAQTGAPQSRKPAADPASKDQIEELVLANRMLTNEGVLDGYGGGHHRVRPQYEACLRHTDDRVQRAFHPWRNLQGAPRCEGGSARPRA